MERKEYSAGAVKLSFWFIEFRKVVELLHEGKNAEQIKSLALNENLFAAPTTLRANQIYHTVTGRNQNSRWQKCGSDVPQSQYPAHSH